MTRSIHADLLTDQKKTAYKPSLQAIFQDNNLPHPDEQLAYPMTGYSGTPTASVATPTEIVRAHRVSGVGIQVQVITDPTVSSQWTTGWTTVAAGDLNYPALFWTGSHIVLFYQDTTTKDLMYRRSDDHGATWPGGTVSAATYFLNNRHIGCSAGATRSGVFTADGVAIRFWRYTQATEAWALEASYNHSGTVKSIGAVNPASNQHYKLAVIIEDYASWTDSALLLQSYNGDTPAFAAPKVYAGLQGGTGASPAYYYTNVNLELVDSNYWLSFYLATDTDEGALFADGDQLLAFSDDGVYFTAGVKLDQKNIADRIQPLVWGDDTYLASDTVMLKSSPPADVTLATGDILSYDITDKAGPATLEMTLDNRDGSLDTFHTNRLGCDLAFERGTVISGTARRCARETFIVDRITRAQDGNSIEIHAYNYFRLLTLWHADLSYYYAGDTVQVLVQRIAALAGIHAVSFDASAFWTNVITVFSITPGQSAADALGSLAEQFQFVTRISSGHTLACLALSATPSADYTFGKGSGEHPTFFPQDEADRRMPNITHAQVIGTGAAAEKIATELQRESGRQFTHRITRTYITSAADAGAAATAIMTKVTSGVERSTLVCMPAFHLQPFDVVSSDDFANNTLRYIASLHEVYNPHGEDKYTDRKRRPGWWQTLTLSELTGDAAGMSGINLIDATTHGTALVRGSLVSFDSATWKALVRLDESHSAIPMYVGEWISPANLDAGRRVAVLLFDAANPEDGLVIGTFGAVRWRQFDRLYASDGSSVALQTDANGYVGVGIQPHGIFHAANSAYHATALFERSGQTEDYDWIAARCLATKTSNMADGFGAGIAFEIQDNAGVQNLIGIIGARRSGADNTGDLLLYTYTAGAQTVGMLILSTGTVTCVRDQVKFDDHGGIRPGMFLKKGGGAYDTYPNFYLYQPTDTLVIYQQVSGATIDINTTGGLINLNGSGVTVSHLTASQDVQTDGSKNLVSVSDTRFKKDLQDMAAATDVLAILKSLRGRYFYWDNEKLQKENVAHFGNERTVGLVAQEVMQVLPEACGYNDQGDYWSVSPSKIVPLLVEVCKEQQTQIEAAQARLAKLETPPLEPK